ncbi:NADP-specific glutamate dehydrogenase, putative [Plasmodium ovale]|uniref:Glutamate dehydrogenase n=2 Tax=Plasmodium ovale TaxID=36330 RepID=A0A1A8X1S8_PLAOA|nr:NADP-specific glutamate dehydrogenase, putative (GDH1) [Plasmodium ovale curtisi]SBS97667.1 NADP-specific glutamate dehydrogenase, putative (GDH1) [Plasmodium ovale curtisi]SCP06246.1 NADP-specific glutamate dehydrogenase, putative [Plasmodium ovale]
MKHHRDHTGRFLSMDKCAGNYEALIEEEMNKVYERVKNLDSNQVEFLQAFHEILYSLKPLFVEEPKYLTIIEMLAEPERVIQFRVCWLDDNGIQRKNRGFRVQYNSILGPYKGGLRFHPSVNLSIVKFLGFEQIFKNSLTGLQMGGGKGGSDFDPKGKSDNEIMKFCQSFMNELYRHIGPCTDVPAGDIGVGGREIGYLFGQYKKIANNFNGTLTGKNVRWGGSNLRTEATGYGLVYFALEVLNSLNIPIEKQKAVVSGSGNVALYCVQKLLHLNVQVLTLSDSDGYIYEPNGFTNDNLNFLIELKEIKKGRIKEYLNHSSTAKYFPNEKPWCIPCTLAFPCATQNEIDLENAKRLHNCGCILVAEGANMPSTVEAINYFKSNEIVFCPAKAANAGGVAISGLEMSQNFQFTKWTRELVDEKLKEIMKNIFTVCSENALKYAKDKYDLQAGANIAGFLKVAESYIEQGCF